MNHEEFEQYAVTMTEKERERALITIMAAQYMRGTNADTSQEEMRARANEAGKTIGRVMVAAAHRGPITEAIVPKMIEFEEKIREQTADLIMETWTVGKERRGKTMQ